ncbi:ribokinase [Chelonobacter oris]|uniref:ribokinase n=1 Tax=Chelonobacter oris TaxID=505317 RepID=UPI00244BA255|nr:ribokinase [Chelonobacter oris]MDH3000082.1 ribokinase [Chelonobacter oris]
MSKPKKLVVLGSINADHVISVPHFVKPGETLSGSGYHIAYGGKGANQAVAAARLGAETDFIACIGQDDIGRAMKQAFAEDNINTDSIVAIADEMSGIAMIQVADGGENSIVIAAGANGRLDESVVAKFQQNIMQADTLLMQLETPLAGILAAAKLAKQNQTRVVLNPAPAQPLPQELLAQVDMITPNETEAKTLTGINVVDEATAQQAAEVFHQQGIQTVLITLGSKGVFVSEQGQNGQIIAGFRVQAVDTTAAGDTFNGALLTALLEDQPLADAIRFAHAAAAISVTRKGAQPSIPTRHEVAAFLQRRQR